MLVLIIPPDGLLEMIESDRPILPETALLNRGNHGPYVSARLQHNHHPVGTVHFHPETTESNERAQQAVVLLSGAHLTFTGVVAVTDIPAGMARDIIYQLSRGE